MEEEGFAFFSVRSYIPQEDCMNKTRKLCTGLISTAALLLCSCASTKSESARGSMVTAPAAGEYTFVISGEDWGPATEKLIVNAGKTVAPGDVTSDAFTVSVHALDFDWTQMAKIMVDKKREVVKAYTSDISGNKTDKPGTYITLELPVGPADSLSSPFFYDVKSGFNDWKTPYDFRIESRLFSEPAVKAAGRICPGADTFSTASLTTGNIKLMYAWYKPAAKGKHPLIIWLHGAGEGGKDPYILLLGNKVTALAGDKIQNIFGGAYILAPQSPLVWMTQGGTPYDLTSDKKASMYSSAVETLIHSFVAAHPDIDTNRIYIGGCSNGGYMTVNIVLRNPGYFAAAFPICEAYSDSYLSDSDIAQLAKEHMWFTAAATDTVVKPADYILPTVDRIRKAGGKDIHESYFDSVLDTSGKYKKSDGTPYEYMGHWSWLYVLNNRCTDNGITIMEWLASNSK
jgi:predicted esterase